jgi:LacI family transcriptional regulator
VRDHHALGQRLARRVLAAPDARGDSGGDAVSALLALPTPPSGLIVGNTAQVRSALHRVKQSAVNVPDDLSLIVFDDNPWTELVSPPLSVVRQPIDMLALHSVELAVGRLKGALTEPPKRIRVDAEFVQRASSAPRPSPIVTG